MNVTEILVVDDDLDYLKVLGLELKAHKFDVQLAESAHVALEMLIRNIPDIVIVDVVMPGMSGLDLMRFLKQDVADMPMIAISGAPVTNFSLKTTQAGADAALRKPLNIPRLINVIRELHQGEH